jgi:hypothetical protein
LIDVPRASVDTAGAAGRLRLVYVLRHHRIALSVEVRWRESRIAVAVRACACEVESLLLRLVIVFL